MHARHMNERVVIRSLAAPKRVSCRSFSICRSLGRSSAEYPADSATAFSCQDLVQAYAFILSIPGPARSFLPPLLESPPLSPRQSLFPQHRIGTSSILISPHSCFSMLSLTPGTL